jgi:hypothetical protein
MRSAFAERVAEGFYVNVEVNRPEAAITDKMMWFILVTFLYRYGWWRPHD